jgi:DNA repair exonuclease SbcCD nuclease subunit
VLHVLESRLVHVRARPDVVDVDGLRIACLPWASRAQLTANSPGISRGAAVEAQTEALERVLDDLRARGADILTAHWSVQGAVLGSEADIAIVGESEPVLPLSSLEGPWLYAALGHIHGQQSGRVGQTAWAYSGSIDRMNFGEEKEPKVALEFNSDEPDHKMPHHLPARRFVTIDDATTGPHDVTDAIVRVRLRRTEDELRELDRAALERELLDAGAARVLIQVDVVRPSRARAERVTASLSLEESIAEWFNAADVDETDRPVLTDMAKALAEETAS